MIQLNYRDTKPIYEQVKDGILQMIYTQVLSPEEKLPSVREMASRLAINPNTISRAYKELEQEGILYTQSGIGTFVNKEMELQDKMTESLYQQFDKVTRQLFLYSVTPEEINERVQGLAKGGLIDDSSK
ncbi:MAG: GntR family transcriptional regulator [Lachnospiraceae bacterium]|nr:GntR family transcriptional regulator [Lachnospiraceae bacterium]